MALRDCDLVSPTSEDPLAKKTLPNLVLFITKPFFFPKKILNWKSELLVSKEKKKKATITFIVT